MSNHALESLFAHLFGPEFGAEIARLADCQEGERVAVLTMEREPDRHVSQPNVTTDAGGTYDAGEEDQAPADPLPSVKFLDAADLNGLRASDVVVGMPPVADRGPGRRDTVEFVEQLALDGSLDRAVLLLPMALMTQSDPSVREALLSVGAISEIVTGQPRGGNELHGSVDLAAVSLKFHGTTSWVRISELRGDYADGFSTEVDPNTAWAPAALDPDLAKKIEQWARQTKAIPLRELSTRPKPTRLAEGGPLPLAGRAITAAGIDPREVVAEERARAAPPHIFKLRPGDLVGRSLGADPLWCVIPEGAEHLSIVSSYTLVVRPTRVNPTLLQAFLKSEMAVLQLRRSAQGATIPRVTRASIDELLIPDLSGVGELDPAGALATLRSNADALIDDLTSEVSQAFSLRQDDLRRALVDAERDATLAASMIRRVREDSYRAQQTFPHPLARSVRQFEQRMSAGDDRGAYDELLRFNETVIIFLGIVLGSYMAKNDGSPAELDEWRAGLQRGGVSLGHWHALARAGAEDARRSGASLGGLASAMRTKGPLETSLDRLLARRNDDAHGAAPRTPFEYEARLNELRPRYHDVLDGLRSMAHCEFFIVESLTFQDGRGFELTGRDLRGDHPDFEPWSRRSPDPLDTDIVHIRLDDTDIALRAYCHLVPCTQCLRDELYYPDRLQGDELRLRSLERGHQLTMVDPHAGETLLGAREA